MNNKKKIIIFTGSVLMPLLISGSANAAIFKCVSQTGNTYYLDKPCPVKDKETQMKAVKDPKNGYIPPKVVERTNDNSAKKGTMTSEEVILSEPEKKKRVLSSGAESNSANNTTNAKGAGTAQNEGEMNNTSTGLAVEGNRATSDVDVVDHLPADHQGLMFH